VFADIVKHLSTSGLAKEEDGKWRRFIIEKPFGSDLNSARQLNRELHEFLKESQVYRIDHYLGKETGPEHPGLPLLQRHLRARLEPPVRRPCTDHVAETLGVEHRGAYYDQAGALRDMVPIHMMQLISLTAMEPPASFEAGAIRDEQVKVLRGVAPFAFEDVLVRAVRGQYDEGIIAGKRVPAYRSAPGVVPESRTETFVALKFFIDDWRWAGVPFYIRTGKRLAKRISEISIHFRHAPLVLFRDTPASELTSNILIMNIQPDEGISLRFGVKEPGSLVRVAPVDMDFRYADYFRRKLSTGYDRLLYDCIIGDPTLFERADMVEAGWAVVDPVLDVWKALPLRSFPNYRAGTWGPPEAFELIEEDGRSWRTFE
jgi:glucose-6-phosphate 1-dehydrogenase